MMAFDECLCAAPPTRDRIARKHWRLSIALGGAGLEGGFRQTGPATRFHSASSQGGLEETLARLRVRAALSEDRVRRAYAVGGLRGWARWQEAMLACLDHASEGLPATKPAG